MKLIPLTGLSIIILLAISCNHTPRNQVDLHTPEELKNRELYNLAVSLYGTRSDSAFLYFNKIASDSRDSILRSSALTYMGIIQYDLGDYFGSQDSYLQSQQLLRDGDPTLFENLAANYNGLGQSSRMLKNNEEAIKYFDLAIRFSTDTANKLTRLNNKAATLKDKKMYRQAISIYSSILRRPNQPLKEYARVLSNMGNTKWLQDSNYNAAPELLEALAIREKEQDKWGLTASYRHLCDYYIPKNDDSARFYAQRLQRIAFDLNSADDERDALTRLIPLSPSAQGKAYFKRHLALTDSIQISRNNDKNQFAPIRYGVAKQKEANLTLQKENAENQLHLFWLQASILLLIIVAISGFIWYRNRKEQAMRDRELKVSQKVHDVVANGIYSIMAKLEYDPQIVRDELLDEMEILYEQSRDLSHEGAGHIIQGFDKDIARMISSFSSPTTRVSIVGNTSALWEDVKPGVQNEVMLILKEFLINMKKHSAAQNVVIKFINSNEGLQIQYTDDGIGLPEVITYGYGLKGTENRIKAIGGLITFDNSIPKGLKIDIIIPITHL